MQKIRDYASLKINNTSYSINNAEAFMMLADYLRLNRALTGTKIVCAEGDCGACTVLCSRPGRESSGFIPINSCIVLVGQLDQSHILTVESLKNKNSLSPVQEALVKAHASQCGFCTPGFTMAISALCEKTSKSFSAQTIKNQLTGNLCRCTGYQVIIDAVLKINKKLIRPLKLRYAESKNISRVPMHIKHDSKELYAPLDLGTACLWLSENTSARVLGAATDVGVMINKQKTKLERFMSLHLIHELNKIEQSGDLITVGAGVTLSELRKFCLKPIPEFARFINIFASLQIKNMATLVGNIANGSPIADTLPFLYISSARLHILNKSASREININKLYKAYKTLDLNPDEFITHISFVIPKPAQILRLYKITQRRDLDIATVNGAFCCELDQTNIIKNLRIALGGIAETVVRLPKLEDFLLNKALSIELIDQACALTQSEIHPLSDLRGSESYRRMLVEGMMRRFFLELMRDNHAPTSNSQSL